MPKFTSTTLRLAASDLDKRAGKLLAESIVERGREHLREEAAWSRSEALRFQTSASALRVEADEWDQANPSPVVRR